MFPEHAEFGLVLDSDFLIGNEESLLNSKDFMVTLRNHNSFYLCLLKVVHFHLCGQGINVTATVLYQCEVWVNRVRLRMRVDVLEIKSLEQEMYVVYV